MRAAKPHQPVTKRRAARFAAIQALYQIDLLAARAQTVVDEFDSHRLSELFEPFLPDAPPPDVDRAWFKLIVLGASEHVARLDELIAPRLADGWSIARLAAPMRALLRAATYELGYRFDVPTSAVVDEYVELAFGFFQGSEPGFVNALLERLARELRADAPTV